MSEENKNVEQPTGENTNTPEVAKEAPQNDGKVKKPITKKPLFWVLIVAIVVIIIAIATGGEDAKTTGGKAKEEKKTEQTTEEKTTKEKTTFEIGEAAELNGACVTLNKVTKSNGSQYQKPKTGNEYVIAEVTIENSGENEISYISSSFKMKNSQGNITNGVVTLLDQDTHLDPGELAKGGKVTGTIVFEQPKDDPELQLIYEGIWSIGSEITFNVSK